MTTGKPWDDGELRVISRAYIGMKWIQDGVIPGPKALNKAKIKRANLPLLDGRSPGSWEAKMMNCSAAISAFHGWPDEPVKGYKPAPNYQGRLAEILGEEAREARICQTMGMAWPHWWHVESFCRSCGIASPDVYPDQSDCPNCNYAHEATADERQEAS